MWNLRDEYSTGLSGGSERPSRLVRFEVTGEHLIAVGTNREIVPMLGSGDHDGTKPHFMNLAAKPRSPWIITGTDCDGAMF